jgi:hypothetical protein
MHIVGLIALNALFLVAGSGILWGVRGWKSWREYGALSGVAYMCGVASVTAIATLVPIYGGSLSGWLIVVLAVAVALTGFGVGLWKRRPRPGPSERWTLPSSRGGVAALLLGAVTAVLLLLQLVAGRLVPLTSWDAWAFWMPKAKAIYYFGGLDPSLFRTLWGPNYPLFVPVLAAMNFRFMDAADTTMLAVQWALLAVGFVGAVAGLLRRIAPAWPTWLFLATFAALPEFDRRLLERTADWPLDLFFGVAACALLAWIVTRESWLLAVFGTTLAATLLIKREGQLLAVVLVLAGLVAAGVRNRRTWPAVAGTAAIAYLPSIPWRMWWTSRHLQSDTPGGGFLHATFKYIDKAPAAFHLVARLLFEYHMWLATAPIALVAAVVCLTLPDRRAGTFFLVAFGVGFVGWAWENWAYSGPGGLAITTDPGLNPTNRTVGSLVVLATIAAPVLIGQLVAERASSEAVEPRRSAKTTGSASASATNA